MLTLRTGVSSQALAEGYSWGWGSIFRLRVKGCCGQHQYMQRTGPGRAGWASKVGAGTGACIHTLGTLFCLRRMLETLLKANQNLIKTVLKPY